MSVNELLAHPGVLTIGACTGSGPTHIVTPEGHRTGFEPGVAASVAEHLGLEVKWESIDDWDDLFGALNSGRIDAVVYNQSITEERLERFGFTGPYGVFHESILVWGDNSGIRTPLDLVGKSVGAIDGTTNITLALAIEGAQVVSYPASVDDFNRMVEDVRTGVLDALVDDEIYLGPFVAEGFQIAFTVPTSNAYGIVTKRGSDLTRYLEAALAELRVNGGLRNLWEESGVPAAYETPVLLPFRSMEELKALVRNLNGK